MSWQDIKYYLEHDLEQQEKELAKRIDNQQPVQDIAYVEGIIVGIKTALNLLRHYYE